ncbi:MAG: SdpI family protein [archaeon]
MRKAEWIALAVVVLSFVIAGYFYPLMPDKMVSHWGAAGQPNGFMDKTTAILLMPVISVILLGLFYLIPKIDPLKENIQKFRNYFDSFIIIILAFMQYIFLLTIYWNTGNSFNMNSAIIPAIAILFYYSGILIENSKRNWFIGIRTPWTLSNENVWNKTHKIGGKLFKATAIISLIGLFFGENALYFMLVPAILTTIYTIAYSYVEYKKETS